MVFCFGTCQIKENSDSFGLAMCAYSTESEPFIHVFSGTASSDKGKGRCLLSIFINLPKSGRR